MTETNTNYTKKAVHGAGIVFTVSIATAFFAYLIRLVLAKNLSVEQYGLFYSVLAIVLLVGLFRSIGLNSALAKFIPEFKAEKKLKLIKSMIISTVMLKLIVSTIIFLILIFSAKFLAINYFHNIQAAVILQILAIMILIYPFTRTIIFVFSGFKKMHYYSLALLVSSIFIFLIVLIGVKFNKTAVVPALAYLFAPILMFILFAPILLIKVFPEFRKIKAKWIDKNLIPKMLKFGVPVMFIGIGYYILGYTDTIMLTYFSGLKQVGLYNVALPTARLLLNFGAALAVVILPFTSELWTLKKIKELREGINLSNKYLLITLLPAALIMFSFPKLLINLFFGSEFVEAYPALKILSIGIIFLTLTAINSGVLSGIGKPKLYARAVLMVTVFNIIFNLILIPIYGFIGAAIATSISYLLLFVISFLKLKKFITLKIPISYWLKILLISLIFILIVYLLKSILILNVILETIIVTSIALLIYLVLLFLFKLLTMQEIRILFKRIFRS